MKVQYSPLKSTEGFQSQEKDAPIKSGQKHFIIFFSCRLMSEVLQTEQNLMSRTCGWF